MIPYAEKIVSDYLREHPAIEALQARVVGKTPGTTALPWVRVTQLDAAASGGHRSDHLIEFYFQLDCYAGADKSGNSEGQPGANTLARTVREALIAMPDADHEAVVNGVDIRSMARIPDTDLEPARERFVLTFLTWIHN